MTQAGGLRIIVLPFEDVSGSDAHIFIARGFTYDIIVNSTRFDDLFIYWPETSSHTVEQEPPADADYVLSGTVLRADAEVRGSAALQDAATGQNIRTWTTDRPLIASSILVQADIADRVASASHMVPCSSGRQPSLPASP